MARSIFGIGSAISAGMAAASAAAAKRRTARVLRPRLIGDLRRVRPVLPRRGSIRQRQIRAHGTRQTRQRKRISSRQTGSCTLTTATPTTARRARGVRRQPRPPAVRTPAVLPRPRRSARRTGSSRHRPTRRHGILRMRQRERTSRQRTVRFIRGMATATTARPARGKHRRRQTVWQIPSAACSAAH